MFFLTVSECFGQKNWEETLSLEEIDLFAIECICDQLRVIHGDAKTAVDINVQKLICPEDIDDTNTHEFNVSNQEEHNARPQNNSSNPNSYKFFRHSIDETKFSQIIKDFFSGQEDVNSDDIIQRIRQLLASCLS